MATRRKPPYTVDVWGSAYSVRGPAGLMPIDYHSEDSARVRAELCNEVHALAVKLERQRVRRKAAKARARRLARAGKGKRR